MTLQEAIQQRHSVRRYISSSLPEDVAKALQDEIEECNRLGNLHIQLVQNEPKAFSGTFASYGKFSGVENYIAMVGKKGECLDENIGYYGERIVLLAQSLGLNTCWVGMTFRKTDAYEVFQDEKLVCMIAIGYGENNGVQHKLKSIADISNTDDTTPSWFKKGVEAALLAPSAINQQKYRFEYVQPHGDNIRKVRAIKGFSMVGYTHIDLGIAKLHFELGAGKDNFEWE